MALEILTELRAAAVVAQVARLVRMLPAMVVTGWNGELSAQAAAVVVVVDAFSALQPTELLAGCMVAGAVLEVSAQFLRGLAGLEEQES